jgi:16S rRNA processing protein RimM
MTRRLTRVGRIARPHGVAGELNVVEAGQSSGGWHRVKEVFVGRSAEEARPWKVRLVRGQGRKIILAVEGISSPEAARALCGLELFVALEDLPPLEGGARYDGELIGLEVVDIAGRPLGRLIGIFDNGAHDIFVVEQDGRQHLVPAASGIFREVNIELGRIVVDLPGGLWEL